MERQQHEQEFEEFMLENAAMLASVAAENNALAYGLELLWSAMDCGALDGWQWISSIIDNLTTQKGVDAFVSSIPETSVLHENGRIAAASIVKFLNRWHEKEKLLSRHDNLNQAFDILNERFLENKSLIGTA